jgi:hypothetical protein
MVVNMDRRALLTGGLAMMAMARPAFARDVSDQIVDQLKRLGYSRIEKQRTLLGRTRILAESATRRREIIVNPGTGEILRDYWEQISGGGNESDNSGGIIDSDSSGSDGGGSSGGSSSGNGSSGGSSSEGGGGGGHDDGGGDGGSDTGNDGQGEKSDEKSDEKDDGH